MLKIEYKLSRLCQKVAETQNKSCDVLQRMLFIIIHVCASSTVSAGYKAKHSALKHLAKKNVQGKLFLELTTENRPL